MLKTAFLFAICSLVIAALAPQLLSSRIKPLIARAGEETVESAPVAARAPAAVGTEESAGFREAVLRSNARGQYLADVLIGGQSVPMVVDTGASFVSLSWDTAMRLGISQDSSGRRYRMTTANGEVIVSAATVSDISFQGIYMKDVEAIISPPGVATPDLLGTSFLKRLASVEQRDGSLILRQ